MGQYTLAILSVLIFVAVVIAVQAVLHFFFSVGDKNQRVNRRLTMLASGMQHAEVYAALVRKPTLPFNGDPELTRLYERFSVFCRQAGLQMTPLRFLSYLVGATLVLWAISLFALRGISFLGVIVNGAVSLIASAIITSIIAWFFLNQRRTKRLKALEEQLPLSLDIINRALRAGHPVVSAVQLASEEVGDPIGSEFGLIVDETTYGFDFKDALANFARRSGSADARFFAVSVGIQSETGGNLAEILEGLARVMRGRATLGKRVRALSSEGRISAYILSALPLFLIAVMMLLQPRFYTSKISDPIFIPAVSSILAFYFIGWLIIRRIINFRY